MRRTIFAFLYVLLSAGIVFGQDIAKNDASKAKTPVATALDFTAEEAQQLKEIAAQAVERKKEQEAAGKSITQAKSDEDAVKSTLRYQLASERLNVLQLIEALTVLNAKIRVGCLNCEYKGGTLLKPEPSK